MGGEQVYLFDINDPNSSKQIFGSSWKSLGNVMSLLLYMHVNKNYYCMIIHFLIGSIERDQKLDKYYMKQNNIDETDFVDKNVNILPPHIEEIKRLVSLYRVIPYTHILNKKLIFNI